MRRGKDNYKPALKKGLNREIGLKESVSLIANLIQQLMRNNLQIDEHASLRTSLFIYRCIQNLFKNLGYKSL